MTCCVHDHSRWGAADQIGAANQGCSTLTIM
jgi:hypothetical protein